MAKNSKIAGKVVGVGAGLAAAAVIGAYFLGGKHGAKNRAKVKSWMLKARGEVLERVEKLEAVSEGAYKKAVQEVAKKYSQVKNIDPKDINSFTADLKKHWRAIGKEITKGAKKAIMKKKSSAKKKK